MTGVSSTTRLHPRLQSAFGEKLKYDCKASCVALGCFQLARISARARVAQARSARLRADRQPARAVAEDSQAAGSEVLLLLGGGSCPWGEAGSETMSRALDFREPVLWSEAAVHLSARLRAAVPGLAVRIVNDSLDALDKLENVSLCACVNVSRTPRKQGGIARQTLH